MTALDELAFDGRPFDALAAIGVPETVTVPVAPTPVASNPAAPTPVEPTPVPYTAGPESPAVVAARLVAQLRGELVTAHLAAMDVQTRWPGRARRRRRARR